MAHAFLASVWHTLAWLVSRPFAALRFLWQKLKRLSWRGWLLLLLLPPALLFIYILALIPLTPSISDIRKATQEQPAQIFSADGVKLTEFKQTNHEWVKLAQISPQVIDALIATEDQHFYDHHGLDWKRLFASFFYTLTGDRQGGSTITQQLARNLYPDEIGRAPTLNRKLKEAITAIKIESVHSKDEILETYLNTVPFLYNAYGIEMAARTYFDTSASSLSSLQGATLVGMLKGNTYYNPVLNPERALQRRNTVLALMARHNKLSASEFDRLKTLPLGIDFERQPESQGIAPHFSQQLRKWLIDWADRNDYNIYRDGLVVHTTLDYQMQTHAIDSVEHQLSQLQKQAESSWNASTWNGKNELVRTFIRETPEYRSAMTAGATPELALAKLEADTPFMQKLWAQKIQLQAGFLAIDPQNGQIKAWVGSRNFEQDGFDHVAQAKRQPGSTFKPFVYGEAFRQGASPFDTLIDRSLEIPISAGEVWRPTDSRAPSGRAFTLRSGLTYSKNTITAQLMLKVGPENVAKLARAMGVRQSKLNVVPSLALGTSPVTLKEMVAAYSTIANSGNYLEPMMVTRIEDRHGKLLAEFVPAKPQAALDPKVDYTLLNVMRGVVDRGTGSDIRNRFGIQADVAGKTGTTQDNADGWFILMHRQLVAGAWVGFNDSRITLNDYWGQGARSALPIVGEFFKNVLQNHRIDSEIRFESPDQKDTPITQYRASEVASDVVDEEEASAPDQAASTPVSEPETGEKTIKPVPEASAPASN